MQVPMMGLHEPMMKESYGVNEVEFPITVNVSRRTMISNMMSKTHTSQQSIAHREGISPFGKHQRTSAPERIRTSKQEQLGPMYQARELVISDSDIHCLWLSSMVD